MYARQPSKCCVSDLFADIPLMAFKDTLQNSAAPVFLRLVLGFTMLWSGLGKLFTTTQYTPQEAVILAQLGVVQIAGMQPVNFAPRAHALDAPAPLPSNSFRSSDFKSGTELATLYTVAITIHKASFPEHGMPLWPPKIDTRPWPVVFAWAVAFIQALGGAAVLVGLFTRFFSFFISGVMLGALWLTQIGPAMQSGDALLGFLPNHGSFDESAWMPFGWIICLLAMAIALTCAGSGGLSIDRFVGGSPKPASKPKPRED
jgi:uncharacterized membrane protein YphA (DoxX/SURF4 family)